MTKPAGTVEVSKEAAAKAEAAYEAELDAELAKRVEAERSKTAMDAAAKTALEAAQQEALAARKAVEEETKARTALEVRLKSLEDAKKGSDDAATARKSSEEAETLRLATILAKNRVAKDRVEGEAKRLAALGRTSVEEIMRATPAPTSDPLILGLRSRTESDTKDHIRVRAVEEGNRTVPVFEVADWSHYGPVRTESWAGAPTGHAPTKGGA